MSLNVLRIDASARHEGSVTRELNDRIEARMTAQTSAEVARRDLSEPLPFLTEAWIAANFTDPAERNAKQKGALATSDELVAELKRADILLIGLPIYNFGVPASLKAWIDLVARARETFRYTENGPVGLLEGKRAIVTVSSGGTEIGSAVDFATDYVTHVLGFIGITDVVFVNAGQLMVDSDASLARAADQIDALELAA